MSAQKLNPRKENQVYGSTFHECLKSAERIYLFCVLSIDKTICCVSVFPLPCYRLSLCSPFSIGYFIEPTIIQTSNPKCKLLEEVRKAITVC